MTILKHSLIALVIALAAPLAVHAQAPAQANLQEAMSAGVVKKVDLDQAKVTISHGPLTNLDMPAMTMVFRVTDPKMLESLKAGDNIRFTAEKVKGAFTVTRVAQAG